MRMANMIANIEFLPIGVIVTERSKRVGEETQVHQALEAGTCLVAGEVVEVVHDGAAQMAEDEPEYGK
jgi:hypothetical protein